MFLQIIQAPAGDAQVLRTASYRWADRLGSTSVGWLGCTGGVTQEGVFFTAERFESEQKMWVESGRPGRRRWFSDLRKGMTGEPVFTNCREVDVFAPDPEAVDRAGHIQIVQGRTRNAPLMRTLIRGMEKELFQHRPDMLGSTLAFHPDDGYTHLLYFTSSDDVFDAELRETPPRVKAVMDAVYELNTVLPVHHVLTSPWIHSRRETDR